MMQKLTQDSFQSLISSQEGEALELKEAKENFSLTHFSDYSAAIANEGGGKLILGVNNDEEVVGTNVFIGTENTLSHKIYQSTGLKTKVIAYEVVSKRILVITIPPRPIGRPVESRGKYRYPMRLGES